MEKKESDLDAESWPNPESAKQKNEASSRGIKQRSLIGLSRDELRKQLPERPAIKPEDLKERQKDFPADAEIEYERSVIRIPFYLKERAGEKAQRKVDVMAFDAFMRLIRERPIRNGIGLRQFEFYIDAWELTNTYSRGLNSNITFTLSDTVQPKSICIARGREADFPAMIIYNAIYDVYLGKERIIEKQPGTAFAAPVWDVPPRNVTVAFEKPFESDLLSFSAGTCEGMRSISREEFEVGATEALKIRGQY
jgi:hypothetical protein